MRHSEIVKFIYHFYCTWNTFFFAPSLVGVVIFVIHCRAFWRSFLFGLAAFTIQRSDWHEKSTYSEQTSAPNTQCTGWMRISTVCDTNVDIVQLPLNWILVNATKAAAPYFRSHVVFLCSLLICLRNKIHIGFFAILLHHILAPSIHFCSAAIRAFLPITLEILIFECFLKVLRITPASHLEHSNTVAMPLVSIFPRFYPFSAFVAISCTHAHTKKQSCCKIYFV